MGDIEQRQQQVSTRRTEHQHMEKFLSTAREHHCQRKQRTKKQARKCRLASQRSKGGEVKQEQRQTEADRGRLMNAHKNTKETMETANNDSGNTRKKTKSKRRTQIKQQSKSKHGMQRKEANQHQQQHAEVDNESSPHQPRKTLTRSQETHRILRKRHSARTGKRMVRDGVAAGASTARQQRHDDGKSTTRARPWT